MYKSKEAQKQADRERQRRYREKRKGVTKQGVTSGGVTFLGNPIKCPESVILSDGQIWHPDPKYWKPAPVKVESEYPAVVNAVVTHRDRMENITRELNSHKLAGSVRYGVGGPTFDVVGDILDCVK